MARHGMAWVLVALGSACTTGTTAGDSSTTGEGAGSQTASSAANGASASGASLAASSASSSSGAAANTASVSASALSGSASSSADSSASGASAAAGAASSSNASSTHGSASAAADSSSSSSSSAAASSSAASSSGAADPPWDCDSAAALTLGDNSGDNTISPSFSPVEACLGGYQGGGQNVFVYVAPQGPPVDLVLSVTSAVGQAITVRTDCPGQSPDVVCSYQRPHLPPAVVPAVAAGQSLFIIVTAEAPVGAPFQLHASTRDIVQAGESCDLQSVANRCAEPTVCTDQGGGAGSCVDPRPEVTAWCPTAIALAAEVPFNGTTEGAAEMLETSCLDPFHGDVPAPGGDVLLLYRATQDADVFIDKDSLQGNMLTVWGACPNAGDPLACIPLSGEAQGDIQLQNVPRGETWFLVVSGDTAGGGGPFTVTVHERKLLDVGEPCVKFSPDARCRGELECLDQGGGTSECAPFHAPHLESADAAFLDVDGDGLLDSIRVHYIARDDQKDLRYLHVALLDEHHNYARVEWQNTRPLVRGADITGYLPYLVEEADEQATYYIADFTNPESIYEVMVWAEDYREHFSNAVVVTPGTLTTLADQSACDPAGVRDACLYDAPCVCPGPDPCQTGTCDNPSRAQCAAATGLTTDVPFNADTTNATDVVRSCGDNFICAFGACAPTDLFFTYQVQAPVADVTVELTHAQTAAVSVLRDCLNAYSHTECEFLTDSNMVTTALQAGVPGGTTLGITVSVYPGAGSVDLVVHETAVLGSGDACSSGGGLACATGLTCQPAQSGNQCTGPRPPKLDSATFAKVDADGTPGVEAFLLQVTGADEDGDLAMASITYYDENHGPLPLGGVFGPYLENDFALSQSQPGAFMLSASQDVTDEVLLDAAFVDLVLTDATGLRSHYLDGLAVTGP